jgi:hypothetical protein
MRADRLRPSRPKWLRGWRMHCFACTRAMMKVAGMEVLDGLPKVPT